MNNNIKYFNITIFYIIKKINACSKLLLFMILCTSPLSSHLLNDTSYGVVHADTSTSQLVPGQSFDTGNHVYPLEANKDSALWTNVGEAKTTSSLPFSVNLVNNKSKSTGYALFNGAIDMSQKVSFSGNFSLEANSITNPFAAGDSLGFVLTPKSTDFIANNLESNFDADRTSNVVGKYLGIGGLSDSIFIGRDLYQNSDVDLEGTGTQNAPSDNIAIRQTNNLGELIKKGYQTASVPNTGRLINENMKIEWEPSNVSTHESTVTGKLTYTISPVNGGNATSLSESVAVARSMSLGIIGTTGGYFGILTYSSTDDEFNAYKGTQSVQVNYLDQETEQKIVNSSPSTIKANVGDTLTVLGKQPRDNVDINSYSFLAPEISGYMFDSAAPLIVSNNDLENNVINIFYKKLPIGKAHFYYKYSSDVADQSHSLPTINDTEGEVSSNVVMPELPNLPTDYFVSKVVTANGEQYSTLKDAISDAKYESKDLQFTIIVSKVIVPATSDKNSSESSSKVDKNNKQAEQSSKSSTTVVVPKEQESTKKETINKNDRSNSVSKGINAPLPPPLKVPTITAEIPQSSSEAAIGDQVKYSQVSVHSLEIQMAGTAGIIAGGTVAIGTITGFNKFYKFWKIVKK